MSSRVEQTKIIITTTTTKKSKLSGALAKTNKGKKNAYNTKKRHSYEN